MTRIGCRAHDYGKLPAVALAATLRAKGYNAAQLAMPRAIAGIEDFAHITDKQLAEIRTAFAAQDVEISVLSCYQDLSAPDADARRTAVDAVKRTLGYAKMLGAKMVGSETAWGACTDEEKAARCPTIEQADGNHFFIGTGSGLFRAGIGDGRLKLLSDETVESISTPVHELYYHAVSKQLFIGSYKRGCTYI